VDEYDALQGITMKYSENDSIQAMRTMFEGVSDVGTENNLYHTSPDPYAGTVSTFFDHNLVEINQPINTGLLNMSSKTLMNGVLGGSRLTLQMEDIGRSIMLPDLWGVEQAGAIKLRVEVPTTQAKVAVDDVFNIDLTYTGRENIL
jgi:hypothetical protein